MIGLMQQIVSDVAWSSPMSTTDTGTEPDPSDDADEPLYVDAATRVSNPSAFDDWYYGIEDKLGQGSVGMGVCMLVFFVVLLIVAVFKPI